MHIGYYPVCIWDNVYLILSSMYRGQCIYDVYYPVYCVNDSYSFPIERYEVYVLLNTYSRDFGMARYKVNDGQ